MLGQVKSRVMTNEGDEAFAMKFCWEMADRVKRESSGRKMVRIRRIIGRVWIEQERMLEEIRKEVR